MRKLLGLSLLLLNHLFFFGQDDQKTQQFLKWCLNAQINFSLDSVISPLEVPAFQQSHFFLQNNIKIVDSQRHIASIPLWSLIQFQSKKDDQLNFKFVLPSGSIDQNKEILIRSAILQSGSIYGVDIPNLIFSKANFYFNLNYNQKVNIETDVAGQSVSQILFWKKGLKVTTEGGWQTMGSDTKYFDVPMKLNTLSNSVREFIDVPSNFLKLSFDEYEKLASEFLDQYYHSLYGGKFSLQSKAPPSAYLNCIKGYITGGDGYWERVQVKLDNIQSVNNRLFVQCSISGDYLSLKSSSVDVDAFKNGTDLEANYLPQVNSKGFEIIKLFKTYLANKK